MLSAPLLSLILFSAFPSCDTPTLRTTQGFAMNQRVTWGRMGLRFQGDGVPMVCGDTPVGIYFEGEGSFTLPLPDKPFHQPNVENIKENSAYTITNQAIGDTFTHALIFLPVLEKKGKEKKPLKEDFFQHTLKKWKDVPFLPGFDHLLAFREDPLSQGSVLLILKGKKEELIYLYDPTVKNQAFLATWKPTGFGFTSLKILMNGPAVNPVKKRFIYPVTLSHLDLDLQTPDNLNLKEKATLTLKVHQGGVKLLSFSLTNGRSRFPNFWDQHTQPFKVTQVLDSQGQPLPFSHKYETLLVQLPEPKQRGDEITLTVFSEGPILKNFYGDQFFVLGNFPYYPSLSTEAQAFSFHVRGEVKKPYTFIAPGKTLRKEEKDGKVIVEAQSPGPLSFPIIVVGNFIAQHAKKKGYDLTVYSYVDLKKRGGKKLLKNGFAILDFFSQGMVPYPWEELEVVEIPYYRHFFWQSPAGVIMITSEGMNPVGGLEDDVDTIIRRLASQGVNARYAHEMAHQWYGNLVGWASPYDNWLSESFAEYLSYLFMEKIGGKRKAEQQMDIWKAGTKESSAHASIYGAASLTTPFGGIHYANLLYGKGPLVLHALRKEVGDGVFFKALKLTAMAAQKMKIKALTEDFILILNKITGKDWHPWFDDYVYGLKDPKVD